MNSHFGELVKPVLSVLKVRSDWAARAMDGDPAVEPELDSFSLVLPLPYRIVVIIICGEQICCLDLGAF